MGRPFKSELLKLNDTFLWANAMDLHLFEEYYEDLTSRPTLIVGSGGSLSACHMLSLLLESKGVFSKAVTPLELFYRSNILKNSNVFFVSASGRNSDILFAYNHAIKYDPYRIFALCMQSGTKLGKLAVKDSIAKIWEVKNPTGKDGFLATNSLVGYFTLFPKILGYQLELKSLTLKDSEKEELIKFVHKLPSNFSLVTLFDGWSLPVAIDIESKFTESGLGNVLYSDFRNFGHGRHNWFDKQGKQSALLALVTPASKDLAKKTLDLIPSSIPKLTLTSTLPFPEASLDLLIKSFYLVNAVGEKVGIDPGRPGVPAYGSKLYHLKYNSLLTNKKRDVKIENAILKKTNKKSIEDLSNEELHFWEERLHLFRTKINKTKFGALILDYDGTLCSSTERKTLPSAPVIEALNNFLNKGFTIGIVSGRGKSIRDNLIASIEKRYWKNVVVGYYNGAIISPLADKSQPNVDGKPHKELENISEILKTSPLFDVDYSLGLRPLQLTIESKGKGNWATTKQQVLELLAKKDFKNVKLLESAHSLDVIVRPEVSKRNIFKQCIEVCKRNGISEDYICIGDKGKFPGNDYELLDSDYSLSVDEVSSDPNSCWNLSLPGSRGVKSCLDYFKAIKFYKSHFTVNI